jgi:hypothetical protein
MQGFSIEKVPSCAADAWIVSVDDSTLDYCYGGTRKLAPETSDEDAERELVRLMRYESHLKNSLINRALVEGAVDDVRGELPSGFLESRVGGARCLFRARDEQVDAILSDPGDPRFAETIGVLFEEVGRVLDEREGRIKLTPDFGKFSGVSDILHAFTPHVLGIRIEDGGCGGKASYTTIGILAALDVIGIDDDVQRPVTVIGSDGALGVDVMRDLAGRGFRDMTVADISYDPDAAGVAVNTREDDVPVLPSEPGRFTTDCLARGGVIVPVTHGGELARSEWTAIPAGTTLALAHNLALPDGAEGHRLVAELERLGIVLIPGQILTLGGALTSRLEWFSRAAGIVRFDKPTAHAVVDAVVRHLMAAVAAHDGGTTLYGRMCAYAGFCTGSER